MSTRRPGATQVVGEVAGAPLPLRVEVAATSTSSQTTTPKVGGNNGVTPAADRGAGSSSAAEPHPAGGSRGTDASKAGAGEATASAALSSSSSNATTTKLNSNNTEAMEAVIDDGHSSGAGALPAPTAHDPATAWMTATAEGADELDPFFGAYADNGSGEQFDDGAEEALVSMLAAVGEGDYYGYGGEGGGSGSSSNGGAGGLSGIFSAVAEELQQHEAERRNAPGAARRSSTRAKATASGATSSVAQTSDSEGDDRGSRGRAGRGAALAGTKRAAGAFEGGAPPAKRVAQEGRLPPTRSAAAAANSESPSAEEDLVGHAGRQTLPAHLLNAGLDPMRLYLEHYLRVVPPKDQLDAAMLAVCLILDTPASTFARSAPPPHVLLDISRRALIRERRGGRASTSTSAFTVARETGVELQNALAPPVAAPASLGTHSMVAHGFGPSYPPPKPLSTWQSAAAPAAASATASSQSAQSWPGASLPPGVYLSSDRPAGWRAAQLRRAAASQAGAGSASSAGPAPDAHAREGATTGRVEDGSDTQDEPAVASGVQPCMVPLGAPGTGAPAPAGPAGGPAPAAPQAYAQQPQLQMHQMHAHHAGGAGGGMPLMAAPPSLQIPGAPAGYMPVPPHGQYAPGMGHPQPQPQQAYPMYAAAPSYPPYAQPQPTPAPVPGVPHPYLNLLSSMPPLSPTQQAELEAYVAAYQDYMVRYRAWWETYSMAISAGQAVLPTYRGMVVQQQPATAPVAMHPGHQQHPLMVVGGGMQALPAAYHPHPMQGGVVYQQQQSPHAVPGMPAVPTPPHPQAPAPTPQRDGMPTPAASVAPTPTAAAAAAAAVAASRAATAPPTPVAAASATSV